MHPFDKNESPGRTDKAMAEPRTSWMSLPIGPRSVHRVVTDHRWSCDNWMWNCVLFDETTKTRLFLKKCQTNLWLLLWWLFETPSQGLGRQAFYRAFQIRQNRKQQKWNGGMRYEKENYIEAQWLRWPPCWLRVGYLFTLYYFAYLFNFFRKFIFENPPLIVCFYFWNSEIAWTAPAPIEIGHLTSTPLLQAKLAPPPLELVSRLGWPRNPSKWHGKASPQKKKFI